MPCYPNADGTCQAHGNHWVPGVGCRTLAVLQEVRKHRAEQFARYGTNNDLEDGTGPGVHWLRPIVGDFAQAIEASFRQEYVEWEQREGAPTWMHLVREELAEAFMEQPGSPRLREELLQVAALCVSWIETIDERPKLINLVTNSDFSERLMGTYGWSRNDSPWPETLGGDPV